MPTYPAVTVGNLELTPMQVKWKGPTDVSYTDLGGTLGNVMVTTKYLKADMKADQFGETVLNRKVSGFTMTVTTEFAEVKNKNLLAILFPHGTLVGSGEKAFDWKTNVGDDDLTNAGTLLLHPLSRGPSDVNFDVTCWKACASAESEITFSPKDQAKQKIVWNVLPDTSVSPARFARLGDTTL
jgi:hypothetical protein